MTNIPTGNPVHHLAHDHAALTRRVIDVAAMIATLRHDLVISARLATSLGELREELFHHFAREEEGLFPFVSEAFPEYAEQVDAMAIAHDAICGALARAFHLVSTAAEPAIVLAIFDRFEAAYAGHANSEAELFGQLESRLDVDQQHRLAALVRDL